MISIWLAASGHLSRLELGPARTASLLTPLGGLGRLAPGFVEADESVAGFAEYVSVVLREPRPGGREGLVGAGQQGLGLVEPPEPDDALAEHRVCVVGLPRIRLLHLEDGERFAEDALSLGPLRRAHQAPRQPHLAERVLDGDGTGARLLRREPLPVPRLGVGESARPLEDADQVLDDEGSVFVAEPPRLECGRCT